MKYSIFLVLFLAIVITWASAQDVALFKTIADGKTGYINTAGKVVIPPAFFNGGDFSEGLAPVRANGLYGFIDRAGKWVIDPQYDYAYGFQQGVATVYINATPYLIDRNNKHVFDSSFIAVSFISKELVTLQSKGKKFGIMELSTGKLLADTIWESIGKFCDGVAVVAVKDTNDIQDYKRHYAVMDTSGKLIVPLRKYSEIGTFIEGYSIAKEDVGESETKDVVIDTKGRVLFERIRQSNSYITGDFHQGVARIDLYKYWLPDKKGISYSSEKGYQGYIDLTGAIIFNDTTVTQVKDFSSGRAFLMRNRDYYLIDRKFQQIGQDTFDNISGEGFIGNYAIVEKEGNWGIIDTNGSYVVAPKYEQIDEAGLLDSFFFFGIEGDERTTFGIATLNGTEILNPVMDDFDRSSFHDGLLKAIVNERLTYINHRGKIVWQEQKNAVTRLRALNIDFMNRGYFYAYSKPHDNDIGGFGSSRNYPEPIKPQNTYSPDKLSVIVNPREIDTLNKYFRGVAVYVVNGTNDNVEFNAQDSRLYMSVQAKDLDGRWKDIEYLPSSWCGNSYHILTLEKLHLWKFRTPVYEGQYPTKFRIALEYIEPQTSKKNPERRAETTVYSNEYEGSVNPAQFWNKRTYYRAGIMDPYED